jgi:TRAP-type mannitol/chloroaromatic compound transport system substrate-binding protein
MKLTIVVLTSLVTGGASAAEVWHMQSTFPGSLTQVGTAGERVAERVTELTDGELTIEFQEPGAIVPALEAFDAVGSGAAEAAWSSPGYWAEKVPALQVFAAVPFGPEAGEYLAWMKYGGGNELYEEMYRPHNIHGVICGIITPEASGWFRKEIKTVDDLQGLKMRFFGLGAEVMEKLGVSTQLLAAGDIYQAFQSGTIDAVEFSTPAADLSLGLERVAKHYYYPGWHQPATLLELMVNQDVWQGLDDATRLKVETACDANIVNALAEGESLQSAALEELEGQGVIIHEWPPEILQTLRETWYLVADEQASADPDFARAWNSLSDFRSKQSRWEKWKQLGALSH